VTGYAVAKPGHMNGKGVPVWFGGGKPFHMPNTPSPVWPTAAHSVAAGHEIAVKRLARLVTRRLVPDQEMTGEPAAMQLASPGHDTADSTL
jgi:hypothetical protein